jgi:hypothetical protein
MADLPKLTIHFFWRILYGIFATNSMTAISCYLNIKKKFKLPKSVDDKFDNNTITPHGEMYDCFRLFLTGDTILLRFYNGGVIYYSIYQDHIACVCNSCLLIANL